MNSSFYDISILNLLYALIPVAIVAVIYIRWSLQVGTILYATFRMLLQLVLVGFFLTFIFDYKDPMIMCAVLTFMLLAASWIALRPTKIQRKQLYLKALLSLTIGGVFTLVIIVAGVIQLSPWYEPRYLIPLAAMIFANSMNGLSLAAERFQSEIENGKSYPHARNIAFQASLIPQINMFFAVGIVSLPGMMTGQILAGVDPLITIRYQIMVMCMVLGSSGICAAIYLSLVKTKQEVT